MQRMRRKLAMQMRKSLDLLLMISAFILAAYGTYGYFGPVSFGDFLLIRIKLINLAIFAVFLLVWYGVFALFGFYEPRRFSGIRREAAELLMASICISIILLVLGRVFKISFVTGRFGVMFCAASTCGLIASRMIAACVRKALGSNGQNLRHLLIAGTNHRAIEFAKRVESQPGSGYKIVGFVDRFAVDREFDGHDYSIVTDFLKFPDFVRTHVIDEVMICLPMKSHYNQSLEIVRSCETQGITVRFLTDLFNLQMARPSAEEVAGDAAITIRTGAMGGWPALVKRGIDIVGSLIVMVLLSPTFALAAALIKLTSPGPVFFKQERVGFNKRRFRLYKFRTMVQDAEKKIAELEKFNEVSGPVFKIKNDPRITRLGKYLRKTSVDELPQLFNVLRGDMSLVGPRPLPLRDYSGFAKDWQRRRFTVKPGITCLWQIAGRNSIPFEKWMKLDMQYIDTWSLGLDFLILLKTIPVALRGSGAS